MTNSQLNMIFRGLLFDSLAIVFLKKKKIQQIMKNSLFSYTCGKKEFVHETTEMFVHWIVMRKNSYKNVRLTLLAF